MKLNLLLICTLFLLTGCVSTGVTGTKWYNPSTWFTSSVARKVEKLEVREEKQEDGLLKAAQTESHKTQIALTKAKYGDPAVDVARRTNNNAVSALDAALGVPTTGETRANVALVEGLIAKTVEAEKAQAKAEGKLDVLSEQLKATQAALVAMSDDRKAEAAKNASLANELKNLYFGVYALVLLAIIAAVLYVVYWIRFKGLLGVMGTLVKDRPDVVTDLDGAIASSTGVARIIRTLRHK
jgi:hypothetical protein